jgi:protein-arginine kinase
MQSAYIQLLKGKKMDENERDSARAELIQELLG